LDSGVLSCIDNFRLRNGYSYPGTSRSFKFPCASTTAVFRWQKDIGDSS